MKRKFRIIISLIVSLTAVTACFAQRPSDEGPGLAVKGLKAEVIVRRDVRSIPYIEAKNDADLYFAQGYETARDRLWQMDVLRRVARGRLAEILGKAVVDMTVKVICPPRPSAFFFVSSVIRNRISVSAGITVSPPTTSGS